MQGIVLLVFLIVTLAGFAAGSLPPLRSIAYLPEVFSLLVGAYVLFEGARRRFRLISSRYWLTFSALGLVALCGVLANGVQAAPLLTGLRFYLRALPFFFLPAVVDFSDDQIGQQLRVLLGLALLQVPVAVWQRWMVLSHGKFSGDNVQGTLLDSGTLSIFLICTALVVTGMYLRGRVTSRRLLFTLLFTLLFPTAINETKISAIFIPAGFLLTIPFGSAKGRKLKSFAWSVVLLAAFGAIFVPVYNLMYIYSPYKYDKDLTSYFTDQKKLDRYMTSDIRSPGSTTREIRRGDAISVPTEYLAQDPVRFALGLGLGNTSPSTLGRQYEGRYYELFRGFLQTSFTSFILEIGALGVGLLLVLYLLLLADALAVSRSADVFGGLAVGWIGVTALLIASLFYSNVHMADSLSYLYWYLAGTIAARRMRLALQVSETPAVPAVKDLAPAGVALAISGKSQP
jgi:hypothetical protein